MWKRLLFTLLAIGAAVASLPPKAGTAAPEAALPRGVRAEWNHSAAYKERTRTRERICINGLWRWQPADPAASRPPAGDWGFFKVPGCWPGITNYMQKDSQTVYAHAEWGDRRLRDVKSAWYEREIAVPSGWSGRRVVLQAEYVNSFAAVFINGKPAGLKFLVASI